MVISFSCTTVIFTFCFSSSWRADHRIKVSAVSVTISDVEILSAVPFNEFGSTGIVIKAHLYPLSYIAVSVVLKFLHR